LAHCLKPVKQLLININNLLAWVAKQFEEFTKVSVEAAASIVFHSEGGGSRFLRNTVNFNPTTRRYIPEDRNLLKSPSSRELQIQ